MSDSKTCKTGQKYVIGIPFPAPEIMKKIFIDKVQQYFKLA